MSEAKWAELLAMLMKYASEIFSTLEGFKTGRLIVEADAEKSNLKIVISKDAGEKLDIDFSLTPKSQQVKKEPSAESTAQPTTQEKTPEEQIATEETKTEEQPSEVTEEEITLGEKEEDIFDIF